MKLDKTILGKEYSRLEKRLFDEMYRAAGKDLVKEIFNVLETRRNSIAWFYSPLAVLGGIRPYDYCNAGKHSTISDILTRIEWGVFS